MMHGPRNVKFSLMSSFQAEGWIRRPLQLG